jgi:hypothetical protein
MSPFEADYVPELLQLPALKSRRHYIIISVDRYMPADLPGKRRLLPCTEGHDAMTVKEPGTYARLDTLAETLLAADSLIIYRQLLQDEVLTELRSLLKLVFDNRSADSFDAAGLYCSVCSKLYSAGMGLKEYVLSKLLHSENCFSRAAGVNGAGCLDGPLKASVRRDLETLQLGILKHKFVGFCARFRRRMSIPLEYGRACVACAAPAVTVRHSDNI